jgi:hypothetical protein
MNRTASCALACLVATGAAAAQEIETLGFPGWSMETGGDVLAGDEDSYVMVAVEKDGAGFAYGCVSGVTPIIAWIPGQAFAEDTIGLEISVGGSTVWEAGADEVEPGVFGMEGPGALAVMEAIYSKESGAITLAGGGLTQSFAFDEEKAGWPSELALVSCGEL